MDVPKKDDILLLADEKFDFDLSLSSLSANEDDEVFFGPVGHKERCIAASLELNNQIPKENVSPASESQFNWSPLTGEKFVEIYKEAHLLALQIESDNKNKEAQSAQSEDPGNPGVEKFLQESKLKINLFEKEKEMQKSPQSLKRETYHLSDIPVQGSPLLRDQPSSSMALQSAPPPACLPQPQGPPHHARSSLVGPRTTAHPLKQTVTQKKGVSKLPPPRASSIRGKSTQLALEKPTKDMPASPSRMKATNEKDVPPAQQGVFPSTAGSVASLPASGSHLVQGKRLLSIPNKSGLKKTLLKPPGCASSLARKSSSLGSVSAKASERSGVPVDRSHSLSNTIPPGRTGPAPARQSVQAAPMGVSCKQSQGAKVADLSVEPPRVPDTAASTQTLTPEPRGLGRNSRPSLSQSSQLRKPESTRRRDSSVSAKAKALPTPTNPFKVPKFPTGELPGGATPQLSQAQRPQSCSSVGSVLHSTPARNSSGPASQSSLSSTRTPMSTRRLSALPTPAGRRLSGLQFLTPRTMPRTLASPLCMPTQQLSSEPQKKSSTRMASERGSNSKAVSGHPDLWPDGNFSPPFSVPQALSFSPEKIDCTFSKSVTTEVAAVEVPPEDTAPPEAVLVDIKLDQLTITPKVESTPLVDLPLIDFSNTPEANVALGSESRPLIDLLVNTPDMSRSTALKPGHEVGQLIDLASPLIQLSPEADKENVDSPLIKF
ncbi:G2 and S phase-expressed protein 1 isoform X2 [Erinaceus europaeus]|uniref:G2 and S phase-expressed protein 1 n=1 Tax=Erinaceus europaeus TaxID=9365 RepID=A0A1S2ZPG2_ERIEU|nr:G2 and S phase-expressed protein 1 isoform X2 [Erinaceus europaeus]XP_060044773.1 G2 and S phase-expressed protein 1 isoform X2 [Erinaceus europaeus]XP_060044774.1 G2 and S phase-expressed protein 1 isoform X2 [Erinaceus europaeus]